MEGSKPLKNSEGAPQAVDTSTLKWGWYLRRRGYGGREFKRFLEGARQWMLPHPDGADTGGCLIAEQQHPHTALPFVGTTTH